MSSAFLSEILKQQKYSTTKVKDRFGDYGLVGLILFEPLPQSLRVDTFLLSCRALGRGIEHRMLARLGQIAQERRLEAVEIRHIPTARNQLVLDFLGRIDHQVKLRGFRIELGEIEAALTEYSDVQEAVVLVQADTSGQKRLEAV